MIGTIQISIENRIPIYLQIAQQLKTMMAAGHLNEGDRLPGRHTLARELGVNVNTINYAFRILENDGFIYSRRGAGSFALKRTEQENRNGFLDEIRNQLEGLKRKAANYGFSAEEFSRLVQEILCSGTGSSKPTAVFVECHDAWTSAGAAQLKQALGLEVEAVVIPDNAAHVQKMTVTLEAADIVLTTHYHLNEIRGMLSPNKFIFALDQHTSYDVIRTLMSTSDKRVAVPFLKSSTVKRLDLSLKAAGCQVNLVHIQYKDLNDLRKKLKGYKVVLLPPNHIEEIKTAVADDVTIVPITTVLTEESVQYLKRSLSKIYGDILRPGT